MQEVQAWQKASTEEKSISDWAKFKNKYPEVESSDGFQQEHRDVQVWS